MAAKKPKATKTVRVKPKKAVRADIYFNGRFVSETRTPDKFIETIRE